MSGRTIPASSWLMSSSVFSMPDIALSVSSSFATSLEPLWSLILCPSISRSRLSVCSGWRRSWLAAARKRDFPRFACSAKSLAASSASLALLRSVISSIITRILRLAKGSSRISSAFTSSDRIPRGGSSTSISRSSMISSPRRMDIEAVIIDRVELSTHGLPRLDRKGAVEGTARRDDAKLLVEHDERLANSVDDAVGIGPRCLDCPFGGFPLGYVGKGDDHPFNPIVPGPVGQNAADVPRSVVALDLAVRRQLGRSKRVC